MGIKSKILNFIKQANTKKEIRSKFKYSDKDAIENIWKFLSENKITQDNCVILCIGTSKLLSFDCFGPMLGTQLFIDDKIRVPVYGTMDSTLNALNIKNKAHEITKKYPNHKIIAIDAGVVEGYNKGDIVCRNKPMVVDARERPGLNMPKKSINVGDIAITVITATMPPNGKLDDTTLNKMILEKSDFNIIKDSVMTLYLGLSKYLYRFNN